MELPFTQQQFFAVFEVYNQAIWPVQVAAYALGLLAVILAFRSYVWRDLAISAVLSLMWLWMGLVYQFDYFSSINKAAYLFGTLFVAQAVIFIWYGMIGGQLEFQFRMNGRTVFGSALVLYAIILYLAIGTALGHGYPRAPIFGVAPCPTTIFTFGLLLWSARKVPWPVYAIPLLWSLIGTGAAFSMGVWEDYGLLVAGIAGTALIVSSKRQVTTHR